MKKSVNLKYLVCEFPITTAKQNINQTVYWIMEGRNTILKYRPISNQSSESSYSSQFLASHIRYYKCVSYGVISTLFSCKMGK